jgi:hypothetical protein
VILRVNITIDGFGQDANGDLYATDLKSNTIYDLTNVSQSRFFTSDETNLI